MNLYKITKPGPCCWDEYESAVVAAESEQSARLIHPDPDHNPWDGIDNPMDKWCVFDNVSAQLIGVAEPGTKAGIIISRYNAG
jgi:hypothetical protein